MKSVYMLGVSQVVPPEFHNYLIQKWAVMVITVDGRHTFALYQSIPTLAYFHTEMQLYNHICLPFSWFVS